MPDVSLDLEIRAPIERVWKEVVDIERYPESMASVISVKIEDWETDAVRRTEWAILLKGATLVWKDREVIDHQAHTVEFTQVSGDLELFEGSWNVTEQEPSLTRVQLTMTFEIGVPLLADMLNPVAQRALHENCTEMLKGVETQAMVE